MHIYGHHGAPIRLAGVVVYRELGALALSHTTTPRPCGVAPPENSVTTSRADSALRHVCAGAQSCPLTSTRVEGGARQRLGGGGTVHTGQGGAQAPGSGATGPPGGARRRFRGGRAGPRKAAERHDYIGIFFPARSLAKTDETIHLSFVIGVYSPKESAQF